MKFKVGDEVIFFSKAKFKDGDLKILHGQLVKILDKTLNNNVYYEFDYSISLNGRKYFAFERELFTKEEFAIKNIIE